METKFFSVKWYEPLSTVGRPAESINFMSEAGNLVSAQLPKTRGWHEQTVEGRVCAGSLTSALRRKGFALVSYRAKGRV